MRPFKFLYALALTMLVTATASSCTPASSQKMTENAISMSMNQTLSGSYLAGRFAQRQQDWDQAQHFMSTVIDHDDSNNQLVQRTFLLALGAGNYDKAKQLAEKISGMKDNTEMAVIFLSCEAISRNDYEGALRILDKIPAEGFGQYTKPLLTTWAFVGQGRKAEALKLLAASASPDDPIYRIHAGMIEELSGNMNEAEKHYRVAMANGLDLHTAIMVGNFYERYGQPDITRNIYQKLDQLYPFNPFVNAMAARDPHRVIEPNITRASDGAALALFDLASLLYGKRAYDSALIYNSMVELLDPKSPFARLMAGDIAALHNRYTKAVEKYEAINKDSPIFWMSRMRVAEIYETSGHLDKALKILTDMVQNNSTRVQALVSLGDIYRRHNSFEKAIDAYDQALAGIAPLTSEYWPIIYARGTAKERLNRWEPAERDLLQALSFQPNNPMILNFIAYSWADQGIHLDKALEYAKQAAALRPNDGYILDSYGWTLFRQAKYQESITWLEQAVELIPNDSTLLDHLGDAYWQVGRKSEAQYQWKRAHDLSQDSSFKKIVEQKIQHGIVVPGQIEHKQAKL